MIYPPGKEIKQFLVMNTIPRIKQTKNKVDVILKYNNNNNSYSN